MANVHRQMQAGFLIMPAALGAQVLGMLFVAARLGPADFGAFNVVFTIMLVINFVTEMGIGPILMKLVARRDRSVTDYIALALPLVGGMAILGAVTQVLIVWFLYADPIVRIAGFLGAANTLAFAFNVVVSGALRGLGEMFQWMLGFLGQKLLFLVILGIAVAGFELNVATAVGAWAGGTMLVGVYYLLSIRPRGWRGQLRWDAREVRELLRESLPVGGISALNQLGINLDPLLLAAMHVSQFDLGLYSLGHRLLNPARNVLHGAVSTPTFPGLCVLANQDRERFARQASRISALQWSIGLPLAVVAWIGAPLFIHALMPDFAASVPMIWILVWALPPACLTLQLRYVYMALSRQAGFLACNVIALVVKAVLIVVLTWRWGTVGTAIAAVLAECAFVLLVRFGLAGTPLRLAVPIALVTAVTGTVVAVLWLLGPTSPLSVLLGGLYVGVAGLLINRVLGHVRRDMPRSAAPDEEAVTPVVG